MHTWWIERFESGLYFLPGDWTAGLGLWFDETTLVGAVHPRSGVPFWTSSWHSCLPPFRILPQRRLVKLRLKAGAG